MKKKKLRKGVEGYLLEQGHSQKEVDEILDQIALELLRELERKARRMSEH
jgi:hypothetical protein